MSDDEQQYTCQDGCGLTGSQWVMQEHYADPWFSRKHAYLAEGR